ncbi:OLC1v1023054C1 [Oldenlandia corymbosa var. corymbosa]|uniref:OLC1v1023054C1 n=1 Tax=Oldenlandia corymbosa var. corymbosa TaxID=529605 RepID=A0AAV1C0R3_OLDCO|nr:OLC1v1023054C1 [Oldenlandia corymbosa var. corymbosa]
MMESPPPLSRYVPQTPSKRVFTGSSSACMEDEVVEIPPPAIRRSKRVVPKQKEVLLPEIIDVDMDDVCPDMLLFDKEVDKPGKGKEAITKFLPGSGTHGTGKVASGPDYIFDDDDFKADLFYGENEAHYEENGFDMIHDDYFYDEQYAILQSHLDSLDIPPGVEVPVPWFSDHQENKMKSTATTAPSLSTTPMEVDQPWDGSISVNSSHVGEKSKEIGHSMKWESSSSRLFDRFVSVKKAAASSSGNIGEKFLNPSSKAELHKSLNHFTQTSASKVPYGVSESGSLSNYRDFAYRAKKRFSNDGPLHVYSHKQAKPNLVETGGANDSVKWPDIKSKKIPSFLSSGYKPGFLSSPDFVHVYPFSTAAAPESSSASFYSKEKYGAPDEFLKKFETFKRFDMVEDFSDHHFSKNNSSTKPPREWAKKIQEEWRILEEHLPGQIFVRVYESRMDLLRAVIIGAEGTPYHDGLFFFDVFFPSNYPSVPPLVHYLSRGYRINPNLYNSGKVCLSLLNTWNGSGKEKWIPKQSTILQVLVSIQGLILNTKPYFNEPGYASMSGSPEGEKLSLQYNENTFILSLKTMVGSIRNPPKVILSCRLFFLVCILFLHVFKSILKFIFCFERFYM